MYMTKKNNMLTADFPICSLAPFLTISYFSNVTLKLEPISPLKSIVILSFYKCK